VESWKEIARSITSYKPEGTGGIIWKELEDETSS